MERHTQHLLMKTFGQKRSAHITCHASGCGLQQPKHRKPDVFTPIFLSSLTKAGGQPMTLFAGCLEPFHIQRINSL